MPNNRLLFISEKTEPAAIALLNDRAFVCLSAEQLKMLNVRIPADDQSRTPYLRDSCDLLAERQRSRHVMTTSGSGSEP